MIPTSSLIMKVKAYIMNTTTLKQARDLWLYDGIVAKGYRLFDGEIEPIEPGMSKKQLFMLYAPAFNFELNADQIITKINSLGRLAKVGKDRYIVV